MQIIAGQNVSPNSMPGPTGFGFGSGHNPNAAAVMMNNSGVAPTTSKTRPTLTHVDLRYWLMADCGLTVKLSGRPMQPDQRQTAYASRTPPTIVRGQPHGVSRKCPASSESSSGTEPSSG